jgi:glycosyltransferase involved in cell wall biosynthesis
MTSKSKLLFVYNGLTSFVKIDHRLLQEHYDVRDWYVKSKRILVLATIKAVADTDVVLCWFASWHALLPVLGAKLFGKPSIVIVGGYDTANLPEANYGSQRGGFPRLISRLIMRLATRLITNSEAMKREAVENAKADPTKITSIYHSLDIPTSPDLDAPRNPIVLTVGNVWEENLLRKGLLPFVQAAALVPEAQFILVGAWKDDSINTLKAVASPNVEFTDYISDEALGNLYSQASVYVQASLHEGFGMSLAEAMLAGCVPVVTRVGALPEVVGETGIYTESNAPKDIAASIRQALNAPSELRHRARKQIAAQFTLNARQFAFIELVDSLLKP